MTNKVKVNYNERFNWLMHHHYVTKNFNQCKQLTEQVECFSKNNSEYAGVMKGLLGRVDGQVQESLKHFQAASAINPCNINTLKHVAKSFSLLGMYEQALRTHQEAECLAANDWEVAHHKAFCYMKLQDPQHAKEFANKALQLKPAKKTLILLATILQAEGDESGASRVWGEALKMFPDHPDLLCKLGLLCMQKGDMSNAFSHVSKCVALSKQHLGGTLVLGALLQVEGSGDVALSKYKSICPLYPDSAPLWNNLSWCFFAANKLIATVSCLKRASYLKALEQAVLYNTALVCAHMGLFASAFHHVSLSLALKLKSSDLMMLLAVILSNLNDTENAHQAYSKALHLNSKDCLLLVNYSVFLFKNGEIPLAREYLMTCKQCLKDQKNCQEEIKELSSKLEKLLFAEN